MTSVFHGLSLVYIGENPEDEVAVHGPFTAISVSFTTSRIIGACIEIRCLSLRRYF